MSIGKLIGFLAFAISLYILWQIHHVLLLAFTAVVFATVINRLVRQLQKIKLKRSIAVPIAVLVVLGAISSLIAIFVLSISGEWQRFTDQFPSLVEQLQNWYSQVQEFVPRRLLGDIESLTGLFQQIPASTSELSSRIFSILTRSIKFVLQLILVIAIIIMLLANPHAYRHAFILLFPAFYRQRVDEILCDCEESLFGWLLGILFNMTVIALMSGIGLWALGVQLPIANAILAGLLTYIPNLGPTLSVIPPAILALTQTPWKAGAVILLYIAIQQIESNVLTPLVMKKQVTLLPAITLLVQVIFGFFFGIFGLFLALPLAVVLQVWLQELLVEDILNDWKRSKDFPKRITSNRNA